MMCRARRVRSMGDAGRGRLAGITTALLIVLVGIANAADAKAPPVDASTMHHKVMVGYQGWFRCPGDPVDRGWRHWSRGGARITPETLTFEMWPDMSEYGEDERYAAGAF